MVEAPPEEVEIQGLAAGGDGVARLRDGRVIFVPMAAPGDRARVRITENKPKYCRGEIVDLLHASERRTEPACGSFGLCGGCTWQHLDYAAQVEAKAEILAEALRRIGGFAVSLPRVTPSPDPYHYRHRARLVADGDRFAYRARGTHELIEVSRCPVLVESLEAVLAGNAEVVQGDAGDPVEWELAVGGDARARAFPLQRAKARAKGARPVELQVGVDSLQFSSGVFFQANAPLFGALAQRVHELATRDLDPEITEAGVVDLFAGAGYLTVPLARDFQKVWAFESNPHAVRDLRANVERAELGNVEVTRVRVEEALGAISKTGARVVVVDPPRTGLSRATAVALRAMSPRRIVYLSCDPATLARDVRRLCEAELDLAHVEAFDLFPQTAHVEALVCLESAAGTMGGDSVCGASLTVR